MCLGEEVTADAKYAERKTFVESAPFGECYSSRTMLFFSRLTGHKPDAFYKSQTGMIFIPGVAGLRSKGLELAHSSLPPTLLKVEKSPTPNLLLLGITRLACVTVCLV